MMTIRKNISFKAAIMAALLTLGTSHASVAYYPDQPQALQQGSIIYITGGVGEEERLALESVRKDYNLRVMNSSPEGSFTDDTQLVIYDSKGNRLAVMSAGPLFYANLPSGKYTIAAESGGEVQRRNIRVSGTPANLHFVWK